jgi:hypothetical protein
VVLAADTDRPAAASVEKMASEEMEAGLCSPERYAAFSRDVQQVKTELLAMLRDLRVGGKRVAGYGAPAKGNTLLNYCGVGTDLIEFTVDRSPHKQNLLLPGSQIPILAPEALVERMPDCAVILPWNIAEEIVGQQREYTARGGRFIVPVPRPQYLDVTAAVAG